MIELTTKEVAAVCEKVMKCNCDLDKWQPECTTGHSWVCRIHEKVVNVRRGNCPLPVSSDG